MIVLLLIGFAIAIATIIMSYIELVPFFKAINQLNSFTTKYPTINNRMLYPVRFISLLKLALPVALDIILAAACGLIGLGGGVIGALIGLMISFIASCMLKIHRYYIAPKFKYNSETWKTA